MYELHTCNHVNVQHQQVKCVKNIFYPFIFFRNHSHPSHNLIFRSLCSITKICVFQPPMNDREQPSQQQQRKKRKSKEHHDKDTLLAKKRKVYQNAKVIQKFRKVREQEIKRERKEKKEKISKNGRVDAYEQVFADTNNAETRLVGNLKGRDKRYQEKKKLGRRMTQQTTSRPNPYNKVLLQKHSEEKITREEIEEKKLKLKNNVSKRKKDAKKLKRRSRKGQPVMENHIDSILSKLQGELKR